MQLLTRFDRYLFRLILVPLLATLVIAAMLLLLEKMLNLFDFVVNEGGPVSVVWRMLANLLPEYLSLGIPIGVMLGILLAFRRLALSSELDALRAVGISYGRLLRVPYLFAAFFAMVNFFIVGFVQPYSRYAYEELRYELRTGALGASIKIGEFARLSDRMTLRVEESFNQGSDLRGVFVRATTPDGRALAVNAARGRFLRTDDPDVIILRLSSGNLVHSEPRFATPRVLSFTRYDFPVNLPATEGFRARGGRTLELDFPQLVRVGGGREVAGVTPRESIATLNRRIVQCVIMFVLPLLAVALAVPPKRSTSALGVFLSVVIIVTYHKVTEYGERMGGLGRIDPVLAQWVPFALFAGLCWWLYHVLAHKPGGQPIGALDRGFAKVTAAVVKLVRRRAPGLAEAATAPAPAAAG